MILIVLHNGEIQTAETDGVKDNRLLIVKTDPPIFDDIECLESWEPGVMNTKRKRFYQKLWTKNFSRIMRAEEGKSKPEAPRVFDVEIEVSGGVAYITKKRPGVTIRLRDYDNENSDTGEECSEEMYEEEEDIQPAP